MSDTISSDSVAQDQLRAFIERIERMEEEKKAIADDIKEIYAEAKGNGFDTKVVRMIIRIRKQDHAERMEQEALLDLYMGALGMSPMPLFDDDDEPPRGGRRQPEHRADMTGMRPIASVASAIIANLEPGNGAGTATADQAPQVTPAVASHSALSSHGADAPVPSGTAKEVSPDASFAPIQPETATSSVRVETTTDIGSARDASAMLHPGVVDGPTTIALQAGTVVTAGETATDHPGGDHANSDGKAVASHASGVSQEGDGSADAQPRASSAGTDGEVDRQPIQSQTGSAAGKSGEAGGVSPSASPAPTKLKMNAEFFDEPHPACQRPGFCGGNSSIALCDACRSAAGTDGHVHDAEERVLN